MGGYDEKALVPTDEEIEAELAQLDDGRGLAVCLVSGGMDSCVTAAIARTENDELAFLHVSYGQRTEARERQAFEALADHFGVGRRFVASIEYLTRIGGASPTHANISVAAAHLAPREIHTRHLPISYARLLPLRH